MVSVEKKYSWVKGSAEGSVLGMTEELTKGLQVESALCT